MATHTASASEPSTLLPLPSEMGVMHRDSSTFPFTIIQCGKDGDLMNVLARLRDVFDGRPSALATSSE